LYFYYNISWPRMHPVLLRVLGSGTRSNRGFCFLCAFFFLSLG
jgi:hypothetical protein